MSDAVYYLILFLGWSLIGWILVGVALYTRRYQRKKEENERSLPLVKLWTWQKRCTDQAGEEPLHTMCQL